MSAEATLLEPTARVGHRWVAAFATAWLGIWMAQLTPVQLLLPLQVDAVRGAGGDWVDSVQAFGVVSALAGLCSLVAYPAAGALSDRTTGRWGRRKPWILGGALVFALALVGLGGATSYAAIGAWWCLVAVGFCATTAALTAAISDQVPVGQRGVVSAWVSAPQAVGTILGLLLVTLLALSTRAGYLLVAALLLVLVVPFLVLAPHERTQGTVTVAARGSRPLAHPDFAWTLLSRVLVNVGNALGTTLLLYFLLYGLGRADAETDLLLLSVTYMLLLVVSSLGLGRLSDRLGRRKPFVALAAGLQAVASLLLAVVPSMPSAVVAAAVLGVGYGAFLSVDQALATQVLPDPASRGRDLGVMNIASTVPQAIAPLLGAWVVTAAGGFAALFWVAAAFALLGGAAVWPVRGVR